MVTDMTNKEMMEMIFPRINNIVQPIEDWEKWLKEEYNGIDIFIGYKNRIEQRQVNEEMISLLTPLKLHCNDKTRDAIDKTLYILQNIGYDNKEN